MKHDGAIECDPRHPHERDGRSEAPILDGEGRCLVCRLDVMRAERDEALRVAADRLESREKADVLLGKMTTNEFNARTRAERAEARCRELEVALRPFAEAWKKYDAHADEHDWTLDTGQRISLHNAVNGASVRYQDYRDAARLLSPPTPSPEPESTPSPLPEMTPTVLDQLAATSTPVEEDTMAHEDEPLDGSTQTIGNFCSCGKPTLPGPTLVAVEAKCATCGGRGTVGDPGSEWVVSCPTCGGGA